MLLSSTMTPTRQTNRYGSAGGWKWRRSRETPKAMGGAACCAGETPRAVHMNGPCPCRCFPGTAGRDAVEPEMGAPVALRAGERLHAPPRGVAWLKVEHGAIRLMDAPDVWRAADGALAL